MAAIKDVEIRGYVIQDNGKLEPHFIYPSSYFGCSCPNVGDTICQDDFEGNPVFYSVQRRHFMFDPPQGWALILREIDPAPPLVTFFEAWEEDTKFWREIDEKERAKELEELSALRQRLANAKPKSKPMAKGKLPTDSSEREVFTPKALAERWLCSERHVRNMINRGEVKAFKHGGKLLRIRIEEVLRVEKGNRGEVPGGSS